MKYVLHNHLLTVEIAGLGAELKKITDNKSGFEFLWNGDESIWGRSAPVLFPIVGKLKDDTITINNKTYTLTQHGFARDQLFICKEASDTKIRFLLQSSEKTSNHYPFQFNFYIIYELVDQTLNCFWEVQNTDTSDMYFSIGAHPGFNIIDKNLSNYSLHFNQPETAERHLLSGGLFNHTTEPVLNNQQELPLDITYFEKDAIVFKQLKSTAITLKHNNSSHSVEMQLTEFGYFGIWCKKGIQDFICLEPWCGLADSVDSKKEIEHKEGIIKLAAQNKFEKHYSMKFSI